MNRSVQPSDDRHTLPNSHHVGLTADQVEYANDALDGAALNMRCSEQECYLAANEFELVTSADQGMALISDRLTTLS